MVFPVYGDNQQPESNLEKTAEKMMALYGNGKIAEMMKAREQLKKAGLSYQASLTLPLEGLADCSNQDALSVFCGMYWVDVGYANVFHKTKEAQRVVELVRTQLHPRLAVSRQLKSLGIVDPKIVRKMMENPDDLKFREEMREAVNKQIEKYIELAKTDSAMMVFMINQSYGALVEGLYQIFSLAVNEKIGPEIISLFTNQADKISRFLELLNTLVENELEQIADGEQRANMIAPIRDTIMTNEGKLSQDDAKRILADIKTIRDSYLNLCK